jgi:hypothetical protein
MTASLNKPIDTDTEYEQRRRRMIFLIALFIVLFFSVRLVIRPINSVDYAAYANGLKALWQGQSPYTSSGNLMPPWAMGFLSPLVEQPLETWLALSVTLFVVMILDLGHPSGLLLLLSPVLLTLIASSNPEWLLVGPGIWLLYRTPKGWGRGLAWLLLACKPQSTIVLLILEGIDALRTRDWKAFTLAGAVAVASMLLLPLPFERLLKPHDWSASVMRHYGLVGAIIGTVIILAVRWKRRMDYKTLGLLLTPVWTPYNLQYNYMSVIFTMRGAGWLRNLIYAVVSFGLAYLFWRDFHVAEEWGAWGMLLLAAILAPAYLAGKQPATPQPAAAPVLAQDRLQS